MKLFKRSRDPRRQKTERFEGWWDPAPTATGPNTSGKIEWDAFASGDSEIEIFARVPDLPDGSEVTVTWGDTVVMTVTVRSGIAKQDLETKDGDTVPRLAGQQVELRYQDAVIARAVLAPD